MGFFSYDCKECGHSLLSSYSADPGINEWMTQAVALTSQGSRCMGEYDGYGNLGPGCLADVAAACIHQACWELAGRPEYDHYGSASSSADDQGYFFNDEHDLIDPRIKDEGERAALLKKGVAAREKARYDQKARDVSEWINDRDEDKAAWERRFGFHQYYGTREPGEKLPGGPVENMWWVEDRLHTAEELRTLHGTEADVKVQLSQEWDEFVASDECKAFLARAKEMQAEAEARYLAELKVEGRYEPRYGVSKVGGDTVGGNKMHRQIFTVRD